MHTGNELQKSIPISGSGISSMTIKVETFHCHKHGIAAPKSKHAVNDHSTKLLN